MRLCAFKKGSNKMRKKVIAGNWKMNKLPNEAIDFVEKLTPLVKDTENEVILCVPYIDLFYVLMQTQGTNIKVGAQNMHWEEKGAYTGEIAPQMLKCINVQYVIIGHSERRQYFAETDETVNRKLKSASSFSSNLLKVGIVIGIGLTIHNLPEGLAIGAGFEASSELGLSLAIAICIHDFPEADLEGDR